MPPNSARVTNTVRAPRSALRRAASTPAGPAPMIRTSPTFGYSSQIGLARWRFCPLEADIVRDDRARPYGQFLRIGKAKLDELDPVFPDPSQELLDELHR